MKYFYDFSAVISIKNELDLIKLDSAGDSPNFGQIRRSVFQNRSERFDRYFFLYTREKQPKLLNSKYNDSSNNFS